MSSGNGYSVKGDVIIYAYNECRQLKQGQIVFFKPKKPNTLNGNGKEPDGIPKPGKAVALFE